MKILSIFIDMLSAEKMNVSNPAATITNMDKLLEKIGGTVYTKSYTPAPDTPRSSACMWTGLYPKENHCNCRIKWPKEDINESVDNIWKVLRDKKYKINIFIDKYSLELGLIPLYGEENIFWGALSDWYDEIVIEEDSYTFVYLQDLHMILDESHYSEKGFVEGELFQTQIIEDIINHFGVDSFDYIMMYSDHGFKQSDCMEEHIIIKPRVKTFMFLRRKNQEKLVVDEKLRSNLDIMPTVCQIIGHKINNRIDGISLLNNEGHKYVLIEDMGDFSVEINQTIEHWGVVLPDESLHRIDCDGVWQNENGQYFFEEEKYKRLLYFYMTDVEKNMHMYKTKQKYKKYLLAREKGICYSNGIREYTSAFTSDKLEYLTGNVELYGAGKVGKSFYKTLKKIGKCTIVGWVDINYEQIGRVDDFDIEGINKLNQNQYDILLICIQDEKKSIQIRKMLTQLGVEAEKIVWLKPQITRVPRER